MKLRNIFKYSGLVAILLGTLPLLRAEKGYVLISVNDVKGRPIRNLRIGAEGIGTSQLTDVDGKARLRVGTSAEVGDHLTLKVYPSTSKADYVMVSPWDSRAQIPQFTDKPDNFVPVVVVTRGEKEALQSEVASRSLAKQILARCTPNAGRDDWEASDPQLALKIVAEKYGLSPDDVDTAIRKWLARADNSFDKGIKELYANNFPQAAADFDRSLDHKEQVLSESQSEVAEVAFFSGISHYQSGNFREAAKRFARAEQLEPKEVYLLYWHSMSLEAIGDRSGALKLAQQAYAIAQKTLSQDDPLLATAMFDLGMTTMLGGDPKSAEGYFMKAIDIERKSPILMMRHNLADSLDGLGNSLAGQGKQEEAMRCYDEAIELNESILGREDRYTLTYRSNRALLLEDMNENDKARAEFEDILAMREKLLGPLHPDVAVALIGLSKAMRKLNVSGEDRARVPTLVDRAIKIDEVAFGKKSRRYASDLYEYGKALNFTGQYSEAAENLNQSLNVYQSLEGDMAQSCGPVFYTLGWALFKSGKFDEAEKATQNAIAIRQLAKDPDFREIAVAQEQLGLILINKQNIPLAYIAFSKAYENAVKGFGADNQITKRIEQERENSAI